MIQAVLSNSDYPKYGVVTVSFPIEKEEYDGVIKKLQDIELGSVTSRDCLVDDLNGDWSVLKRLKHVAVNVDELDYLAKRLDSFSPAEKAKFQATASIWDYFDVADLIDLTFCCQEATIITDFSDLTEVGRNRFFDLNGGIAFKAQLEACDPYKLALELILNEDGKITPYGVIYDNAMELKQVYKGHAFPQYRYDDFALEVGVLVEGAEKADMTWLSLPLSQTAMDRALFRGGLQSNVAIHQLRGDLPDCLSRKFDLAQTSLAELNQLALALSTLDDVSLATFEAAAEFLKPHNAMEAKNLAESVELFDFTPGVHSSESYGKHMIKESGHFEFDENLEGFYDYSKYGKQRMDHEHGAFVSGGYICYHGIISLPELLAGGQCERMDFQIGELE